ncbi:MAG TPA: EutN/CcmL family microcompartment protein [bacterium]|nr:EutN/CcmL family microcompartment protein [bacterium]HPN42174.1 EutN/CcmL family microcompartment protein [bacterium]
MKLGIIVGKVWATQKDSQLTGVKLYVLQPVNEKRENMGKPIIAADAVGAGQGDLVYWVGSREATYAIPGKKIPCDASIVGIVDNTFAENQTTLENRLQDWRAKNIHESRE